MQPDLFVVPLIEGRRPESFAEVRRLLLACEVLSPSTGRADRVVKRALFGEEGVGEFWVVDLESRTFERSTPADPRIEVLSEQFTWHPEGATNPLVIDIPAYIRHRAGHLNGCPTDLVMSQSPVGMMRAVSTIRITARSGARVHIA